MGKLHPCGYLSLPSVLVFFVSLTTIQNVDSQYVGGVSHNKVIDLGPSTFQDAINDKANPFWLLKFYAPWYVGENLLLRKLHFDHFFKKIPIELPSVGVCVKILFYFACHFSVLQYFVVFWLRYRTLRMHSPKNLSNDPHPIDSLFYFVSIGVDIAKKWRLSWKKSHPN